MRVFISFLRKEQSLFKAKLTVPHVFLDFVLIGLPTWHVSLVAELYGLHRMFRQKKKLRKGVPDRIETWESYLLIYIL